MQAGLMRVMMIISTFVLIYVVVLPIGFLLYESLFPRGAFTLSIYKGIFASGSRVEALVNTVLTASGVAAFSMAIGTPLAFGVARTDMWGKAWVNAAILIAVVSPPFLMTIAYIQLAGPNNGYINLFLRWLFDLETTSGPLNIFSLWAFIFLAVPNGVAFVYLQLVPAFRNMDPSLEEAARLSGATVPDTIMSITIPMMRPAVLSGGLLAFSMALAIYGTAHILNLNVLTIAVREALVTSRNFAEAAGLSALVIVLSLLGLFLYRRAVSAGKRYQTMGGKGFRAATLKLGALRHVLAGFGILFALSTAFVPYSLMLLTSFYKSAGLGPVPSNLTVQNYVELIRADFIRGALMNSFMLAAMTATLVVLVGAVIGYIVAKTRLHGRELLDYISIIPLGVAGTALAVGIILVHIYPPFRFLGLYGTLGILLVAYLARFIAFGVRNSQTAFGQVSADLEEAARVHGASPLMTAACITLPLARGTLIYTWVLVFVLAFPEVSASVILRGLDTEVAATALLEIWDGAGGLPVASALGVVMFVIVGVPMILMQKFGGRSVADPRSA
jgi:iron(III) transport system permease protein